MDLQAFSEPGAEPVVLQVLLSFGELDWVILSECPVDVLRPPVYLEVQKVPMTMWLQRNYLQYIFQNIIMDIVHHAWLSLIAQTGVE